MPVIGRADQLETALLQLLVRAGVEIGIDDLAVLVVAGVDARRDRHDVGAELAADRDADERVVVFVDLALVAVEEDDLAAGVLQNGIGVPLAGVDPAADVAVPRHAADPGVGPHADLEIAVGKPASARAAAALHALERDERHVVDVPQRFHLKGPVAGHAVDADKLHGEIVAYLPAHLVVLQPPQRIDRREKRIGRAADHAVLPLALRQELGGRDGRLRRGELPALDRRVGQRRRRRCAALFLDRGRNERYHDRRGHDHDRRREQHADLLPKAGLEEADQPGDRDDEQHREGNERRLVGKRGRPRAPLMQDARGLPRAGEQPAQLVPQQFQIP